MSEARDSDVTEPAASRVYDYLLGGHDNFRIDRQRAAEIEARLPQVRAIAIENRAFLGRVVRYLAGEGVTQFLDIGAGLPTVDNTHQIAQRIAPGARVAYVDRDPIAWSHASALLTDSSNVVVVQADMHDVEAILSHPQIVGLLDLGKPIALMFISVLHFSRTAHTVVDRFKANLPAGSHLALSHGVDTREQQAAAELIKDGTARSRDDIAAFFDGTQLVAPGLVKVADWQPDTPPSDELRALPMLAGVARF